MHHHLRCMYVHVENQGAADSDGLIPQTWVPQFKRAIFFAEDLCSAIYFFLFWLILPCHEDFIIMLHTYQVPDCEFTVPITQA